MEKKLLTSLMVLSLCAVTVQASNNRYIGGSDWSFASTPFGRFLGFEGPRAAAEQARLAEQEQAILAEQARLAEQAKLFARISRPFKSAYASTKSAVTSAYASSIAKLEAGSAKAKSVVKTHPFLGGNFENGWTKPTDKRIATAQAVVAGTVVVGVGYGLYKVCSKIAQLYKSKSSEDAIESVKAIIGNDATISDAKKPAIEAALQGYKFSDKDVKDKSFYEVMALVGNNTLKFQELLAKIVSK
jgi:hypothetical protein